MLRPCAASPGSSTRRPVALPPRKRWVDSFRHWPIAGPDAAAFHIEGGIGLAATRLAIVDHDGGRRPLTRSGGAITVVFNGEIDDHGAVSRASLERMAVHFATRSDTEVLAAAYEAWGTAAFDRLRGMYAAAILDRRKGTLTLVRDPVGERPPTSPRRNPARGRSPRRCRRSCRSFAGPRRSIATPSRISSRSAPVSAPRTVLREIRALLPGERRVFRLDGAKPPESSAQESPRLPPETRRGRRLGGPRVRPPDGRRPLYEAGRPDGSLPFRRDRFGHRGGFRPRTRGSRASRMDDRLRRSGVRRIPRRAGGGRPNRSRP
jgi:hypothetical protein